MQFILGHGDIHVDVLRFVSLFVILDSCETTDRRKKERTFFYDERVRPPALFRASYLVSERK